MRLRIFALGLCLAACTGNSDDDTGVVNVPDAGTPDSGPAAAVVYYRDVKPIIDAKCNQCHSGTNSIAPIDLSVPAVVKSAAQAIRPQVESKMMPPWHADSSCKDYLGDRTLTDEQVSTILEWIDLGAHLGDPNDEGAKLEVGERGLSRIDVRTMMPEPFTPQGTDDYRCIVVEWPETETKFVTGFNLEPTNPAVVHHSNIYVANGQTAEAFRQRDVGEPGPGYYCFGGAFEPGVELFGAWAPGSLGINYPEGTGLQIEPGSVVVMEMHYNTGPGRMGPDQATVVWKTEDFVDRRALIAPFWNFNVWNRGGMPIPAGEADVMHRVDFDPDGFVALLAPWLIAQNIQIHGVGLHMHWLGKSGSVQINRPDPVEDECVLEIPRWDFNWQSGYLLTSPIDFTIGEDTLMLECHWDNRAEAQPVIDGVRRTAKDVNWGTDSDDEMCIGYIYVTEK